MKNFRSTLYAMSLLVFSISVQGQDAPSPFEFGKLWTFENPPKEWFMEAYKFDADEAWFREVRESSLRFATWCSASFVSPDGLIMTNFHCAWDVIADVEKEGEDLFKSGYYAETRADERRAPGLFVEQLLKVEDVTNRVKTATAGAENEAHLQEQMGMVLSEIQKEYTSKPGWEGLRLQIVPYYSGAKFSIYGYKRFDDIRLVFMPEEESGLFGGDLDNFTYPRYNLDCSFWRAYDKNGEPVNTASHYFKFNPDGVTSGTPVFAIGNPGSTERYRTVAQLAYDRDYRYPVHLQYLQDRLQRLEKQYDETPSAELKSDILSYLNSTKAISGIIDGLNNPDLFGKKVAMEQLIRSHAEDKQYWDILATHYKELSKHFPELMFMGPNPQSTGIVMALLHDVHQLDNQLEGNADANELEDTKAAIREKAGMLDSSEAQEMLAMVLGEIQQFAGPEDDYVESVLEGRTPAVAAREILASTMFGNEKKLGRFLEKKPAKLLKKGDPIIEMANLFIPAFQKAVMAFQSTAGERNMLEEKIAQEVFGVFGSSLPPDATFTLRISDGIVKGYEYNGTWAPYKTTFFGLYDRYYSHDKNDPWDLQEHWLNPPMDLLKTPYNFVTTCDNIGGSSGSPVINMNKEVVGLAFDGNIESLPGNFIYDDSYSRAVCVHTGGILAALRYIYKADSLVDELEVDNQN